MAGVTEARGFRESRSPGKPGMHARPVHNVDGWLGVVRIRTDEELNGTPCALQAYHDALPEHTMMKGRCNQIPLLSNKILLSKAPSY